MSGSRSEQRSDQDDHGETIESIEAPRNVAVVARQCQSVVQEQTVAARDEDPAVVFVEQPPFAEIDATGREAIDEHEVRVRIE